MGRVGIISGTVARKGHFVEATLSVCFVKRNQQLYKDLWGSLWSSWGCWGEGCHEAWLVHKTLQGLCDWKGVT